MKKLRNLSMLYRQQLKDEKNKSRGVFGSGISDYFINVDESEVAKVFLGHLET
jgi:hypothetical protein